MVKKNKILDKIRYSSYFASIFSGISMTLLSILCLANYTSIDLFSMCALLKVVIPAWVANWIIGYMVGTILETQRNRVVEKKQVKEQKAYEIPSMFA